MKLTKRKLIVYYFTIVSNILFCNNLKQGTIYTENLSNKDVLLQVEANSNSSFNSKSKKNSILKSLKPGIELGLSYQKDNIINKKIAVFCDYQIKPTFLAGVGIGYHEYDCYNDNNISFSAYYKPIFIHLKANLNQEKISPYFSTFCGIYPDSSISLHGDSYYLNPSFGLDISMFKTSKLNIGIGLDFTNFSTSYYKKTRVGNNTIIDWSTLYYFNKSNSNILSFSFNMGYIF